MISLPEPSFFYKAKGDYYRRLGFYDLSLEFYDKALHLQPDHVECSYWKAAVYLEKGLYFNALLEIKNAFKHTEKKMEEPDRLYYQFAFLEAKLYFILHQASQDRKITIRHYKQVRRILQRLEKDIQGALSRQKLNQPDTNLFLYTYLGQLYFVKGLYLYEQSALERIDWLHRATTLNFKPALALYYQSQLYQQHNEPNHARDTLNSALKLNPNIVFEAYTQPLIIR